MAALKLGTETGSLVNHLMSHSKNTPTVGEGATVLQWSDRTPYKVLEVTKNGKECKLCRMKSTLVSGSTTTEDQVYSYEETTDIITVVYRYGNWYEKYFNHVEEKICYNKMNIFFGKMEQYRDPCF